MKKEHFFRGLFYILGLVVLALGITLNTKTNLGVSPLISVSFCVATLTEVNLGDMTFVWYTVFVLVEILSHVCTKRYKMIFVDLLQIPLCMIFTRFMNLFSANIPELTGNLVPRVALLILAIVFTGAGIGFTLNARLIPNPGDGIVQALADWTGKKVSTMKNILDAVCVCITIVISLIFAGKLIGIGVGTLLAVIGVGRVVAVSNHFLKEKILRLSGLK